MSDRDLPRRLIVAALGIPVGVAVIYFGTWSLAVLVGIVVAVGTDEAYRLASAKGVRPFRVAGLGASLALVALAARTAELAPWSAGAWIVLLGLSVGSLVVAVFARGTSGGPLTAVSATIFGAVYVGGTLSFALLLRAFPGVSDGSPGWDGTLLLIFVLVATWCGDTGAYFAGRRFGRRKLVPSVSPSKTVEGAIGGLAAATVSAALYALLLLDPSGGPGLTVPDAAALGLLIGAVGELGDLVESVLKRDAGVKDSGTLFPGHGGVLDRFDAVLLTLPLAYFLLPLFLS